MQAFFPTLISVLTLLAMASSGFLLKKTNMVSESCIPGFSKVLLYVCQPCLIVYTFASAEFSLEMLCNFGIFFLMLLTVHILMLGCAFLILKRRFGESVYRVITVATTFANCAFFGIPVIEALMPEIASQVVIYTSIYGAFMNIVGWTVGISIISGDKKYISPKKMLLNPAMAGLAVALVIYCLRLPLPKELIGAVTNTGRMATPLSMIIMGMRLATMELKPMFSDLKIYLTVAVKHIVMSLVAFSIAYFLSDVDPGLRRVLFITCSCPIASIVLNYSEIVGVGQKTAANLVLFSTILSVVTMPPIMMLLQFIV